MLQKKKNPLKKLPKHTKTQGCHHILVYTLWKPQHCPPKYNNSQNTNTLTQALTEEEKNPDPFR